MTPSDNLDPEGNPIHYTHPWEEPTPGADADEPSSTPSPQVPRLIPIRPEPVTADDLRREYAATLNLHKPDPDIPSAYPSDPQDVEPVPEVRRKRGRLDDTLAAPGELSTPRDHCTPEQSEGREEPEVKRRRGRLDDSINAPSELCSPERILREGRDANEVKRRRGRLDDSINAPREEPQGQRRRGGQPGNLNALKHGLYIDGRSVRNTTPIERAQLFDINDIIENCKDYMRYTYEHGIRLNDMLEINETMRSLSLAAIGLTRLINTHAEYISTPYSSDFQVKKRSTIIDLVEHYKKKLSPFMDLSDVFTDPNAEK